MGVIIAQLLNVWFQASSKLLENFSFIPFDEVENGQQITSMDQIPLNNSTFYKDYIFNH
jgi:hypothetical protein